MQLTRSPYWRGHFDGFRAPFVHPDPDRYADLAVAAGFTVAAVTVTDRTWEFGSRDAFAHWCAVGSTAWTDRLPPAQRAAFVDEQVHTYETITGQPGLFLFAQLRITLTRVS